MTKTDPQPEPAATQTYLRASAGSSYGWRTVWYKLEAGRLALLHSGDHDNLAANSNAADLEGMTIKEAERHARVLNQTPVGHAYDGCHLCGWSIEVSIEEPPEWLTYQPPTRRF